MFTNHITYKKRTGKLPMEKRILITGGAGFIGSHLADALLEAGYGVRVLDNLTPQVHGSQGIKPDYLNPDAEFILGDVRNPDDVAKALKGVHAVFHLAAAVGVGQSMYEVANYTSVNNLGTAVLLQALIQKPVARLIVASSMSIYGEGLYRQADGRLCTGAQRTLDQLKAGRWELADENAYPLTPVPTTEEKLPALTSVYALSKYDQERMCLMIGQAYAMPTVALRLFNVYGSRQSISNPYTGVLAIFASRYLNGKPPLIFEDGRQKRDFVSVHDVARAFCLALEKPRMAGRVFNIGSGEAYTVNEIALRLGRVLGNPVVGTRISGKYRVGDIRHCFADIQLAREVLGYHPRVSLDEGLEALAAWLRGRESQDRVEEAAAELAARGLAV